MKATLTLTALLLLVTPLVAEAAREPDPAVAACVTKVFEVLRFDQLPEMPDINTPAGWHQPTNAEIELKKLRGRRVGLNFNTTLSQQVDGPVGFRSMAGSAADSARASGIDDFDLGRARSTGSGDDVLDDFDKPGPDDPDRPRLPPAKEPAKPLEAKHLEIRELLKSDFREYLTSRLESLSPARRKFAIERLEKIGYGDAIDLAGQEGRYNKHLGRIELHPWSASRVAAIPAILHEMEILLKHTRHPGAKHLERHVRRVGSWFFPFPRTARWDYAAYGAEYKLLKKVIQKIQNRDDLRELLLRESNLDPRYTHVLQALYNRAEFKKGFLNFGRWSDEAQMAKLLERFGIEPREAASEGMRLFLHAYDSFQGAGSKSQLGYAFRSMMRDRKARITAESAAKLLFYGSLAYAGYLVKGQIDSEKALRAE